MLLHYQPKMDLPSALMLGMEALVRWQHPVRGMVPPNDFIALAEDRALIIPIGRWVMQAACRQIQAWRQAGLQVPKVAVNLSARQFGDEALVDDMKAALQSCGVLTSNIEVGLTESVLMADPERANSVLRWLHNMGVSIAIDDFGMGYSSLSHLRRFPAPPLHIAA